MPGTKVHTYYHALRAGCCTLRMVEMPEPEWETDAANRRGGTLLSVYQRGRSLGALPFPWLRVDGTVIQEALKQARPCFEVFRNGRLK